MRSYWQNTFRSDDPDHVRALDQLPFWSAPFGFVLLETVRIARGMSVLDIGSGTGFPLIELGERLGSSSVVCGVDVWDSAIRRAQEKLSIYGSQHIQMTRASAENLPFRPACFDLIVSNNGLNNVQNLSAALSECFRTCKANGQLVFTVNLPDTMKEFYQLFETVLRERGMEAEVEKMKAHIYEKRKPLEEFTRSVTDAGFSLNRKIESSFAYRFADANAMFHYYTVREFFLPSWKQILPESMVIPVFEELERRLDRIAEKSGEIRLTIPYICLDCRKPARKPHFKIIPD